MVQLLPTADAAAFEDVMFCSKKRFRELPKNGLKVSPSKGLTSIETKEGRVSWSGVVAVWMLSHAGLWPHWLVSTSSVVVAG